MHVGISTASFYSTCQVEDAPTRIAALGVTLCELFLNTFSEYEADFIDTLKCRFHSAGLNIYSIHPMGTQFEPQLFSRHPRQRADALKIYEKVLRAGRTLGAQCYVMHGPALQGGIVKNMELSRVGPIALDLVKMAAAYGLTLTWENVSWCLYCTPDFALRLMDAAKSDEFRFTLDIKQAMRSGYSPLAYVDAVGEYIANLHVCDYLEPDEEGTRLRLALPGRGVCDLKALRMAMEARGYQGPAFLEVYSDLYQNDGMLIDSLAYMRQNLEQTIDKAGGML